MLVGTLVFFHICISIGLVVLILMHSGREGGLGGLGFTPTSQGGTHIVEKNLTRLTIAISVVWFLDTIALFRLLK
ncbi:MAG TPA: preprotein translocase subunit SecG [Gaiellaceae bacterium]|jgi:preprotein translocase subunit SecG